MLFVCKITLPIKLQLSLYCFFLIYEVLIKWIDWHTYKEDKTQNSSPDHEETVIAGLKMLNESSAVETTVPGI